MNTTATKAKPTTTSSPAAKLSKTKASTKAKRGSAKSKTASPNAANKNGSKRLAPGGLDGLVIGWMKKNRSQLPVTAGTVARGIERSSGAVANCLGRQEEAGAVRETSKKPHKYDLVTAPK